MKIFYIYFFIIISFFSHCKKDSKKIISIQNDDLKSSKNTVLKIKSDDKSVIAYLNLVNKTNLFLEKNRIKKEVINDFTYINIRTSNSREFVEFSTTDEENNFYRGRIFLIPEDTISIEIDKSNITFHGKNAIYNNFYKELDKNTPEYNKNPYRGSLFNYKRSVEDIYKKRLLFFKEYKNKYSIKAKWFTKIIEDNLRHEYLFNLMNPANKKAQFIDGLYFNEFDVLQNMFHKEQEKNKETILELKEYFETVSVVEFNDNVTFDNSIFFRMNLNDYIRYYFLNSNYLPYTKEKFIEEKKFIEVNFKDKIKIFAIKELVREYHEKGFGNSKNTIEILENTIDEYQDKFDKYDYNETILKIKEELGNYNFELTKYALNSKLININGDTTSLDAVFKRSNKRIKVIDFWASWCPPCIQQIKFGKDFKDRLSVQYNVEWIYISPEKNKKEWIKANTKYEKTLNFYNSFFLINGRRSSLARFFKIEQIPRYIILDKKNMIVLNNAPAPIDKEIFEKIISDIYSKEKIK